jgi:hypothetical protein
MNAKRAESGLVLEEDGFTVGDSKHAYADVRHLGFSRRATGLWLLGAQHVRLEIWLRGIKVPRVIENRFRPGIAGRRLARTFREFQEKTFEARLAGYLSSLNASGAFDFSDATFFRDGTCNYRGTNYDLNAYRISREGSEWVFASWTGPLQLRINGEIDPDVVRHLLANELRLDVPVPRGRASD